MSTPKKVTVTTTLSDNKRRVYIKDSIYTHPIPEPLLEELESGSGLVVVLEWHDSPEPASSEISTVELAKIEEKAEDVVTEAKEKINDSDSAVVEEPTVEKVVKKKAPKKLLTKKK